MGGKHVCMASYVSGSFKTRDMEPVCIVAEAETLRLLRRNEYTFEIAIATSYHNVCSKDPCCVIL